MSYRPACLWLESLELGLKKPESKGLDTPKGRGWIEFAEQKPKYKDKDIEIFIPDYGIMDSSVQVLCAQKTQMEYGLLNEDQLSKVKMTGYFSTHWRYKDDI